MNQDARILVLDDTAESLAFLVKLLRSAGYEVSQAANCGEGLATALANPPDLILLDIRMEELDGLEVCQRLKERDETRDVPIILVSAFAESSEGVGGLELGAADYATKPFRVAELLARVKTQLSLGRSLTLLKEKNALIQRTNEQLQDEVMARLKTENDLLRSLDRAERSRRALLSALEDEKLVQEEVHRARGFLDSIIENTPGMLLLKDAKDLRIVHINRGGEALLGIPRAELLGKRDHDLFPKAQADFRVAKDREVIERGVVVDVPEEPVQTRDKGERIVHTRKVPILGPQGRPDYVLGISVDITETKRAQDAIVSLSLRLNDLLGAVPEILMEVDSDHVYKWANEAGKRFFGDDVVGKAAGDYFVGEQKTYQVVQPILDAREEAIYVESLQRRRDGAQRLLAWWCRPLKNANGEVRGSLSSARDITDARRIEEERRRLEEQLRASQRMEAIGSLAGGVAHDFNNLLCVLQSYTDFAIRGVKSDDPVKDDLLAIKRAGERAATLTRQLLAFGRRQVMQPVPLNLNEVAGSMEKMLRRILGEDIEFAQVLAPDLGIVRADQGQVEQVLMNLVANARDAMSEGGRLTIETSNVQVDETFAEVLAPIPPGPYVALSAADTGCGMDAQTMGRIFDPFFTTKEKGKGTGLGLATVYGIIKQSKGGVWVRSEVGRGSTFTIYLPRELSAIAVAVRAGVGERRTQGDETVLVVEDEEDLRRVACRALQDAGYTVLSAGDGEEAMQIAEAHPGTIHLLLSDVVMPKMGGRVLVQRLKRKRPEISILYMSGYTDDAILRHGVLEAGVQLLGKPFTATGLTQKVREVLDRDKPDDGATSAPSPASIDSGERQCQEETLLSIPDGELAALCAAALSARYDELMAAAGRLRPTAPAVAARIQEYAERFDYESILELLGRKKVGGAP